jgi:hypothetical protein
MKILGKRDAVNSINTPIPENKKGRLLFGGPNSVSAYKEPLSTFELSTVSFVWLFLGAAKWPALIFTP